MAKQIETMKVESEKNVDSMASLLLSYVENVTIKLDQNKEKK